MQKDGRYALIDRTGKMLGDAGDEWRDEIMPFSEGLARARKNGKYGFIDTTGHWIIPPQFKWANPFFKEGNVLVMNGDLQSFVDLAGNPLRHGPLTGSEYYEGLAGYYDGKTGKYGFSDKSGMVIKPVFDMIMRFQEGLCFVTVGDKQGFIAESGKFAFPLTEHSGLDLFLCDGLVFFKKSGKFGYMDGTGKVVIAPKFESAWRFKNGRAVAGDENGKGVIDKSGNYIVQPKYLSIEMKSNEVYEVENKSQKFGFIDKNGNTLTEPVFEQVVEVAGGCFLVKKEK